MPRLDVNRSGEMEVFVRVVELGGFSAAARAFRLTPSAVSRLVARLERRLGARLLNRSTRKLMLTAEGCAYFERATTILADLDEAERIAASGERPSGRIRLNTSASVGTHILAPVLPEFLARHPQVSIDIVETDAVADLLQERVDIAIRAGPFKSSRLVARKLGAAYMLVVAAPAYLQRSGTPRTLADLQHHNRIGFSYRRAIEGWPFRENGQDVTVPVVGNVQVSDGEALRHVAIGGAGLARLPAFTIRGDIGAGRLVPLLEEFNPGDVEEVHAVYLGQSGPLPARIRAFLDFLAERARVV